MKEYGVLFDYNGVIVDDEHVQEKAIANVVAQYGLELTHDLYNQHCLGRTDEAAFENLIRLLGNKSEGGAVQEFTKQKVEEYTRLIEKESIIHPSISAVLQALNKEYKLGLVTASSQSEVLPVLQQAKLLYFFDAIVTADDVQKGKPDPEGYLKGMSGLGLPKDYVLIVEDIPTGVTAAKASGAKCIAVLHTVTRDRLNDADRIVENVGEITPALVSSITAEK